MKVLKKLVFDRKKELGDRFENEGLKLILTQKKQ